jgi:hypothetical protein
MKITELGEIMENLDKLLHDRHHEIVADAFKAMERSHLKSYEKAGVEHSRQRLNALYVLTVRAVKERNLGPMIAHAETVARERYEAGFGLWEVQTAFNVLEEAIWVHVLKEMAPADFPEALGLVSTVIGAGKDRLALEYVSLTSKVKIPSLDLHSRFSG